MEPSACCVGASSCSLATGNWVVEAMDDSDSLSISSGKGGSETRIVPGAGGEGVPPLVGRTFRPLVVGPDAVASGPDARFVARPNDGDGVRQQQPRCSIAS